MLNPALLEIIACPRCKGALRLSTDFVCDDCNLQFPVCDNIPILINEENSLFQIEDLRNRRDTTYKTPTSNWKNSVKSFLPSINLSIKSRENFQRFSALLRAQNPKPRLLVIGGAVEGAGFGSGNFGQGIILIEADVAFGNRTNAICDAHDLPFKNETFDGVIAQAVLEHVVEPTRCVAEIHRVLRKEGVVYAETPFMQQVHAGRFDFTRFTHLGHRRLFREFSEIESGAACGAGMVLAWSYCYFLQSFFRAPTLQKIAFAFGSFTGFWLKYFDYFTVNKSASLDSASSYFFIGRKSGEILNDKDLIASYRGASQ